MAEVSFDFLSLKSPLHSSTGPGAQLTWLNSSPFRDPVTGAMLGGTLGIRIGAVILLRIARTIHEISTKPDRYPRAAKFLQADYVSLVAESCLESIQNDISNSAILLEPSANARRLSNIPAIVFNEMVGTPKSRETAPISPVEGMENISALFFGEPTQEILGQSTGPGQSMPDTEVCLNEYVLNTN